MFAPLAWLKLQFFCHAGDTEIGGFGISAKNDLLYVEDFVTVRQQVSPVTVRFEDQAVADFFDACVDCGLAPERFGRIWCHTHPNESVTPSFTDEETFLRSFGRCDWAVMFILGRTGRTYARLAFSLGPSGQLLLPVEVDWSAWPALFAAPATTLPAELEQWQQEYAANVLIPPAPSAPSDVPVQGLVTDERLVDAAGCWGNVPWWDHGTYDPELDGFFLLPPRKDPRA